MQQSWRHFIVFCLWVSAISYAHAKWHEIALAITMLALSWAFWELFRLDKKAQTQRALISQLRNSSDIDALTGLKNRNSFILSSPGYN